jgi:hypothetical protein
VERDKFYRILDHIVRTGGKTARKGTEETIASLRKYFEVNWFSDEWISTSKSHLDMPGLGGLIFKNTGMFLDDGLPEGFTRDGPYNTNNWVERAFRTFDEIFFNRRTNKRCANFLH